MAITYWTHKSVGRTLASCLNENTSQIRCALGTGLTLTGAAFGAQVSGWTHWITIGVGYGVGTALMLIAATLITRSFLSEHPLRSASTQASGAVPPGIPTLSALLGQNQSVEFNAKQHFALAYYSPLTAEVEKNIKIAAEQNSPNDKELV